MKLALVGVGTAGGRIVDRMIARAQAAGRSFCHGDVLVFDTDADGPTLSNVPDERRVLIGDMHPDVAGGGVDGDVDLAADAAEMDMNEIRRAFDDIELYDVDAILVVAGLAGGTGAGVGSVLLDELDTTYDKPVYALGVLPAEAEGDQRALNAARALKTFVPLANNVVLFDNETWLEEVDVKTDGTDEYRPLNEEVASRAVALFAAGEYGSGAVAENFVDPNDTARTLETGGVSTIARAETRVGPGNSLLSWLFEMIPGFGADDDQPTDALQIKTLVQDAVENPLTLPCEVSSAERTLFVLSGPPSELSRRGFEQACYWLEQEADTAELLAGDEPLDGSSTLRATVLFSNVTDVPRIDALKEQARRAEDTAPEEVDTGPESDAGAESGADTREPGSEQQTDTAAE